MTSLRLTVEQESALAAMPAGSSVPVVTANDNRPYVLVPADVYEKMCQEDDATMLKPLYPLMDAVASAEGWDDPEMDAYDLLDPRRTP